jgi:hypothetical protein
VFGKDCYVKTWHGAGFMGLKLVQTRA